MAVDVAKHWQTGWDKYEKDLVRLIGSYENPDVLELGGGGHPMYELDQIPSRINSYTVNDVSQAELDKLPAGYDMGCFDVCGDASAFAGRYDVIFSRFLAEHVPDGFAMHRNIWHLLKPGGVAIHLIPTMFASPFIINRLLPERLTHAMLMTFFSFREGGKFPALYSMCRGGTPQMYNAFKRIGYSETSIESYYDHFYYERITVLRQIETFVSTLASKRDWAWYSSFAVIIARK